MFRWASLGNRWCDLDDAVDFEKMGEEIRLATRQLNVIRGSSHQKMPTVSTPHQMTNRFGIDPASAIEELRKLVSKKSVCEGDFVLASGAKSDFYVDAKLTTLDPYGATLVGFVGWRLISETARKLGVKVDAVGGLTMGADPIALSIGIAAYADDPHTHLQTFTVRKEAKKHGRHKMVEGNFVAGNSVVIIDDVITTGGSTIQAINAIENEGGQVAFVLVLVDRQQGGKEAIEKLGPRVTAIFTREQLTQARATGSHVAAA